MALGGCTGTAPSAPTTPGNGAASSSPFPATIRDSVHVLTCDDAGTGALQQRGPQDDEFGGVVFEQLQAQFDDVPKALEVGLTLPQALSGWYFRKVVVYVPVGASPVTVRLHDHVGGALAWVPAEVWTSGSSPVLDDWLGTSVTFQACPDRTAVYFGGVAASSPETCLSLLFEATSGNESHDQRLDGASCS